MLNTHFLRLLTFGLLAAALSFGCAGSADVEQTVSQTDKEIAHTLVPPGSEVETGVLIPSIGALRAHVIFVRFEGDDTDWHLWPSKPDPDDPTITEPWMRTYLNSTLQQNSIEYANLSHFFKSASGGRMRLYGDVLYTSVPDSFKNDFYGNANRFVLQKLFGDGNPESETTALISKDLSGFDSWTSTGRNHHVAEPDSVLDYVIMVYRRPPGMPHPFRSSWHGIASLGFGSIPIDNGFTVKGSGVNVSGVTQLFTRSDEFTFNMLVHEIAHQLLGTPHPYIGASGLHPSYWGLFFTFLANLSVNAYESQVLGWSESQELNNTNQTITLDDFLTTGQSAVFRIRDNEYLYFENRQRQHQAVGVGTSFDTATLNPDERGLFVLRVHAPYSSGRQNLIPVASDGNYNWEVTGFSDACGSATDQPVFSKSEPNPFGYSFRDIFTLKEDTVLEAGHEQFNLFVYGDGDPDECHSHMKGRDFVTAFSPGENAKTIFSTWTNPPSTYRDGRPFGMNFLIMDESDGKLSIHFSEDSFFVDATDSLMVRQDIFIHDELTIPEEVYLFLHEDGVIYMKPDSYLNLQGSINLHREFELAPGRYREEWLKRYFAGIFKPWPEQSSTLKPAVDY